MMVDYETFNLVTMRKALRQGYISGNVCPLDE